MSSEAGPGVKEGRGIRGARQKIDEKLGLQNDMLYSGSVHTSSDIVWATSRGLQLNVTKITNLTSWQANTKAIIFPAIPVWGLSLDRLVFPTVGQAKLPWTSSEAAALLPVPGDSFRVRSVGSGSPLSFLMLPFWTEHA